MPEEGFWSNGRLASFEEADAACERVGDFTDTAIPSAPAPTYNDLLLLVDAYQELRERLLQIDGGDADA